MIDLELETPTAADTPRASRVPPPAPSVNGELRDRVQKLRLGAGGAKGSRGGGVAWLPWVLCLALALTWAGVAMRTYRATAKDGDAAGGGPAGGSSSGSAKPPPSSGTLQLVLKGYVIPARQITVSPIDVGGKIIELNVVEGKLYKQNDTLAKIDPAAYDAAVAEAKATLAGAEQRLAAAQNRRDEQDPKAVRQVEYDQVEEQLKEARANEQKAKRDYDRLAGAGGSAVAGRELQQGEGEYKAAAARTKRLEADLKLLHAGPRPQKMAALEADVRAATADVQAAQARLTNAEWRRGNCDIKAPITGIVLTKKAEKGSLVNPQVQINSGGGIVDMADLAEPEIDLKVAERDIAKLKVGQKCRIVPDAYQDREYAGQIDRIMPIANRSDNTINLRVKVTLPADETPGTFLKPDMGGAVTFLADEPAKK